jgi:hypothetical protein
MNEPALTRGALLGVSDTRHGRRGAPFAVLHRGRPKTWLPRKEENGVETLEKVLAFDWLLEHMAKLGLFFGEHMRVHASSLANLADS